MEESSRSQDVGRPGEQSPYLWRRRSALAIAIIATTFAIATYFIGGLQMCRDHVMTDGTVVEVCRPIGSDDAFLLGLVALLIVMVLLPELTEFSVPGLITIKRAMEEQAKKTEQVLSEVVRLSANQQMTMNLHTYLQEIPRDFARMEQKLERRIEDSDIVVRPHDEPMFRDVSPARARQELQILEGWERLADAASMRHRGSFRPDSIWDDLSDDERAHLEEWKRLAVPFLRDLQVIRNTVAHSPENLSDEQIRSAHRMMTTLLQTLSGHREENSVSH